MVDLIVKTRRGAEAAAASLIEELLGARATPAPMGYLGIVFVEGVADRWEAARRIADEVPEADRVLVVEAECRAQPDEVAAAAVEVARRHLGPGDTFAIRTTRRGSHTFTSMELNVKVGAAVKEATGAEVDLEQPSKPIYLEIFGDWTAVCLPATPEYRKMTRGKPRPLAALRRLAIGQLIYEGPPDAVRNMGVRIGRAAQTFEVGELVVLVHRPVEGATVRAFLEAVEEGIESRYQVQRGSYGRPVHRVPIYLYELYQFVRSRRGEPLVVTDPKGEYIGDVGERLAELFEAPRVNVLVGSREGIPPGIFRMASLVLDLMPEVTIATDFVIPAIAIAFAEALGGRLERYAGKRAKLK